MRIFLHLRLYECLQITVPGLVGILSQPSLPEPGRFFFFMLTYGAHVLSVYSYNDYCDFGSDAVNPRKAGMGRSRRWLAIQTVVLTAVFIAALSREPPAVARLFLLSQILCLAYSDRRIRLKGWLLGSEIVHFVAGASYFMAGVLTGGGAPRDHLIGAVLFGLLYVSGGLFNEIMDCEADREANVRHLVVRVGKRRALAFVFGLHYAGFALLALDQPSLPVIGCCVLALLGYTLTIRGPWRGIGSPEALIRFRHQYRVIFALLLAAFCLARAIGASQAGIPGPPDTGESPVVAPTNA